MDLSLITPADFKALFPRDFPYLPVWSSTELYNAGNKVYYEAAKLFYVCRVNGTTGTVPGTDSAIWLLEDPQDSVDNYVSDADILRAMREARIVFNQVLFSTDENIELGYLYLTAMYLVNDLRTTAGGINGGAFWAVKSRQVGNVREEYGIPDAFLKNPAYALYTQNPYGMKYLSLVYPNLIGNMAVVLGATLP